MFTEYHIIIIMNILTNTTIYIYFADFTNPYGMLTNSSIITYIKKNFKHMQTHRIDAVKYKDMTRLQNTVYEHGIIATHKMSACIVQIQTDKIIDECYFPNVTLKSKEYVYEEYVDGGLLVNIVNGCYLEIYVDDKNLVDVKKFVEKVIL